MADLSVRGLPEDVLERLRAQAVAQGVSLSEWIRSALADRAALPTPEELAARRSARAEGDDTAGRFDEYYRNRLHRRTV